jgi:hypothetical protein
MKDNLRAYTSAQSLSNSYGEKYLARKTMTSAIASVRSL